MNLVQFLHHIVVVICYHGIDEDGVDERHTDDTAEDQLRTEIESHQFGGESRIAVIGGYPIGNLIPAFYRTDLESGVDGA